MKCQSLYRFGKKGRRFFFLIFVLVMVGSQLNAQTPGLIIKPANVPGKVVLDPDGDGYISQKTYSVQLGFTNPPNNDVLQSEIPYVPLVKPDPSGDPLSGPSGNYNDIVGTDAAGNNAVMTYLDSNNNLLFRFRLGNYATNSKSYSVLIDTDQRFGFTGPYADANAVTGNPGFEVEVVLETNFGVEVYKIDGTTTPVLMTAFNVNPFNVNCQKAVALTSADSNPDYFYDFYIPFSQLSSIAGLNISTSTALRMVPLTGMNPSPNMGNNAQSDVGGLTTAGSLDALYNTLIENQTPTSVSNLNTGGILVRTEVPSIDPVLTSNSIITGTSSEANGTVISVSVYQSDGLTLIGSGTTTVNSGIWSINVSSLSPQVILTAGQVIKATATAIEKGASYPGITMVTSCSVQSSIPVWSTEINLISGSKGYRVTISRPVGTKIYLYNDDYSLFNTSVLSGGISNPMITTTNPQTINYQYQTGNSWQSGVYYFRFEEPAKCISPYYVSCDYSTGTSAAPSISTSPVTTSTTTISGTGTAANSKIQLWVDNNLLATTTSGAASPFNWSVSVSSLQLCQVITAKQIVTTTTGGRNPTTTVACISPASNAVTVTRTAYRPVINYSGCAINAPTSISGSSSENGATVQLFKSSNPGTPIGSAIVVSGMWTINSISPALVTGDVLQARVAAGGCLTASGLSNLVTVSTQTNISNYTIGINQPTEGQTSIGGTISSGSYPVNLRAFVDETAVGSGVLINSAGNWSISGLNTFDLAVGSKVQVRLTSANGCESALSSVYATVQCQAPADRTISAANTTICSGSYGMITVQSSVAGVIYTPVASDGFTVFGYGAVGTGGNLNIQTYAITSNSTVVKVKASKFPIGSCDITLSGSVTFNIYPLPDSPIAVSPQTYCSSGSTTLADLAVTAPSGSTINWYTAALGGSPISSSTSLVNGTTYYAESQNITSGCRGSRTAITVNQGNPPAPVAPASQTFCTGATVANLAATLSGPGTVTWYNAASGGSPYSSATALVGGNIYYAQTSQNSCQSLTRTAVTVSIVPIPAPSFTASVTSTCSGSTGNVYTTQAGKSNYAWSVSAQGVITSGGGPTDNSVTVTWINAGTGTVSVNYSNGSCSAAVPTNSTVAITATGSWIGGTSTDWNTASNWSCSRIPDLTVNVTIPAMAIYKPILSSGPSGAVKNIGIEAGASLTVNGNVLEIGGIISNSGTFTATEGSIVMKGSSAQTIGTAVFSTNTIENLTIDNLSGVSLEGPLKISGVLKAANGNFSSGGNLTLLSTAIKTALIDGSGMGEITGVVNIQRYLSSGFGYKYFSSPFQAATTGQFSSWVNLTASFGTFYRYDENNTYGGNDITGWIKYVNPSGILDPMHGYSANFGTAAAPVTVNLNGTVTNGTLAPLTLTNHNRTFSLGFNLVGNPYPSPIDWDSPNLVRNNVDDAIYFFSASAPGGNASASDSLQYQGTYSSYINGVSTGGANNIIPAMQAFFVHVPTFSPLNGSLTFNNGIRVNDLNPVFRSAFLNSVPLLRIKAGYEGNTPDQAVVYFDNQATSSFDGKMDALKIMNTDYRVPNLYFKSADFKNLSINALSFTSDSITRIPMGLKVAQNGRIFFEVVNMDQMPPGIHIYLEDAMKGIYSELKLNQPYRVFLNAGIYENRFSLVFSLSELTSQTSVNSEEKFTIIPTGGIWMVNLKLGTDEKGILQLTNMLGQVLFRRGVIGNESVELDYKGNSGVYVISLIAGKEIFSKKIIIQNR